MFMLRRPGFSGKREIVLSCEILRDAPACAPAPVHHIVVAVWYFFGGLIKSLLFDLAFAGPYDMQAL